MHVLEQFLAIERVCERLNITEITRDGPNPKNG